MRSDELTIGQESRLIARALLGDDEALHAVADLPTEMLTAHRVLPALAARLRAASDDPTAIPSAWAAAEAGMAAHWLLLEATRDSVGRALEEAGVRWLPIKGCDVADRFYDTPPSRPTSDLDILIATDEFDAARDALARAGWRGAVDDPLVERYRAEEGYAWPAVAPRRPLVEVHFRLWGFVPTSLAEAVVESAVADPAIHGHRPTSADAYLLAALHLCLQATPRSILDVYDLERIASRVDGADLMPPLIDRMDTFGVALPVALAASAASTLFGDRQHDAFHHAIAEAAHERLRLAERRVLGKPGLDAFSTADVVLARLLSRRPSRAGWRSAFRRIWAHPGVVAIETPSDDAWARRRLTHLLRQLGFRG